MIRLTKLEAVKRHIDFAIESYFRRSDVVPLCAIAGAAHVLAHDLAERQAPGSSWASLGSNAANEEIREVLKAIRRVPNWMKHADRDSDGTLEFGADELEFILFHIMLDLGELAAEGEIHSIEVSIFQMWFVSKHRELFHQEGYADFVMKAQEHFPDLPDHSPEEQLDAGLNMLERMRNDA